VNERELRRLLKRLLLLSSPLPLAMVGSACGGSTLNGEPQGSSGASAAGSGSSVGTAGRVGATAGSGGASAGSGGASAGSGGASAGSGGASAGSGGADVATSGAGGGGGQLVCTADASLAPIPCGMYRQATVPKACVDSALETVGTPLPSDTCRTLCGQSVGTSCTVVLVDEALLTVNCPSSCLVGRRPAGLCTPLAFDVSSAGAYFASMARLEAASVDAFRILRDELRAYGAPKKLVQAAARAARDEVRHARSTGALARRFGARFDVAAVARGPLRSIQAMALENAVEGCVRETYGALVATWQARAARDPLVRAVMTRIARDETRHAALSWQVGRWLETRLEHRAKQQVEVARQTAVRELLASLANDAESSFADVVGLPGPARAAQLARAMTGALWS